MPRVGGTLRKEVAWGFPFPFLTMQLPSGAEVLGRDSVFFIVLNPL